MGVKIDTTEIERRLSNLEAKVRNSETKKIVKDGAKIVEKEIERELYRSPLSPHTGKLHSSITIFDEKGGKNPSIKVGYEGTGYYPEDYKGGSPIVVVARTLNSGSSKNAPTHFMDKAKENSKSKMMKHFEKEIKQMLGL